MFQSVHALLDTPDSFVIVLIGNGRRRVAHAPSLALTYDFRSGSVIRDADEVESLTAARQSSMSGGEPSDAVRVRTTAMSPRK